jgi:hypothetical protein
MSEAGTSAWELDHLFIWTSEGAPEAEALIDAGLTEGTPNTHPGQGTSNRRFFLENGFLELLWVDRRSEVESEKTRHLHFWDRWSGRNSGSCPFGFIFRPHGPEKKPPPFATWEYHPAYLPENVSILVGKNAERLDEPMLFCMPFGRRPDLRLQGHQQLLNHKEIKELHLSLPALPAAEEMSKVLKAAVNARLINIKESSQFTLEVVCSGGQNLDFRAILPLILRSNLECGDLSPLLR